MKYETTKKVCLQADLSFLSDDEFFAVLDVDALGGWFAAETATVKGVPYL